MSAAATPAAALDRHLRTALTLTEALTCFTAAGPCAAQFPARLEMMDDLLSSLAALVAEARGDFYAARAQLKEGGE